MTVALPTKLYRYLLKKLTNLATNKLTLHHQTVIYYSFDYWLDFDCVPFVLRILKIKMAASFFIQLLSFDDSLSPMFGLIFPNIKLSLAAIVVHISDLPEHFPLLPTLVMYSTDRPHTTCKEMAIVSVEVRHVSFFWSFFGVIFLLN